MKQARTAPDPGTAPAGIRARVEQLTARARRVVAVRREDDPNPDDPFRGLHITDAEVDTLLAAPRPAVDASDGFDARLDHLAACFGLAPIDVDILLTAAAPDLDPRFEAVYGYLNDDVSRRRASIRLALELMGAPLTHAAARARFEPGAPLLRGRLLVVEDADRPVLGRALRVPDRVLGYLLGIGGVDERLRPLRVTTTPGAPDRRVAHAVDRGVRLCYLVEEPGASGRSAAVAACAAAGLDALVVDPTGTPPGDGEEVVALGVRDAALLGAALVVGPVEPVAADRRWLSAADWSPVPVLLVGASAWNPAWSERAPLVVTVPVADPAARLDQWRAALDAGSAPCDLEAAVGHFRLTPDEITRAVAFAAVHATAADAPVDTGMLRAGARAASLGRLERLATRYEPGCGFDDLVVPPDVGRHLADVVARVRHRDRVQGAWGLAARGEHRSGVTALFTGPPGTGKTLSARVIASELGLDLYVVDLATVVDKYIGETEKNLDRVFTAAEGVNGVLLFDEADALFGKRSEVSDARDRHANIEVAYLLQRMEHFAGVAILTSNLRGNIDAAFVRRLDFIVAFPEPDETARAALWRGHLPATLPTAGDVDLGWLAGRFTLTGGAIRNAALAAAYAAAAADRPVGMADLVRAVAEEYRKTGRLCSPADFGPWHHHVALNTG